MDYKQHCDRCQEQLGKPWYVIHRWLDEHARKSGLQQGRHRVYRHHKEGVELVRSKWGDDAAKAAELHIMDDFGYIPSQKELEDKFGMG